MSIPAVREARVAPAAVPPATGDSPPAPSADAAGEPSPFARLVRGLGHEVQRSENVVHQAIASARGDSWTRRSSSPFRRGSIATARRSISRRGSSITRRAR